jgi:glycosyltransferase involved in cell wall biosynthesis
MTRRFRILIVTFTFPPNKDGVAEIARAMAENFAAHGHSVTVATGYSPERTSELFGNGIRVKQFRVSGSTNFREGISGEADLFEKFVASFDGDFLISHGWHTWSEALAERAFPKLNAVKKIMMSHGFGAHRWNPQARFPWGLGYWLGWQPYVWTFPWQLRKYDHLVVNSARVDCNRFIDHLVAKLTRYRKVTVIPNGADPDEFARAHNDFRSRFHLTDKFVLLNVANYSERKNQEFAVRAFARAKIDNAVLVFIGSEFNEYSARAQKLAKALGLGADKLLFLEKVDRETTLSAFKACDVFVLSAKAETQPVVLLEAMMCAKPFISTDTGCVRELPGGFAVKTEEQMGAHLSELAADAALRQNLGEQGRSECLAHYTWQQVGERWERLLARLAQT